MNTVETYLTEFEAEAITTRKFLERLPADKLDWRPHPKSMSAGQLALHIAGTPGQVVRAIQGDSFSVPDFSAPNPQPTDVAQVLQALDDSIAVVRQVLPQLTDERLQEPWRITRDGRELTSMPRFAALRNIVLNHWYHHRGQFGVYLRLLGAVVPSSYGPSGDEAPDFLVQA